MSTPANAAQLSKAASVTLDANGNGTATLGPDQGPPNWHVDGVILMTTRPGAAPIPRAVVYSAGQGAQNIEGLTYDGSFAQGACDIQLTRGQQLLVVWSAGKPGDVATVTVTGSKWS